MKSTIESSNESVFMENVKGLINIELVSNIEYQKKIFIQRNPFKFELRNHEKYRV